MTTPSFEVEHDLRWPYLAIDGIPFRIANIASPGTRFKCSMSACFLGVHFSGFEVFSNGDVGLGETGERIQRVRRRQEPWSLCWETRCRTSDADTGALEFFSWHCHSGTHRLSRATRCASKALVPFAENCESINLSLWLSLYRRERNFVGGGPTQLHSNWCFF